MVDGEILNSGMLCYAPIYYYWLSPIGMFPVYVLLSVRRGVRADFFLLDDMLKLFITISSC